MRFLRMLTFVILGAIVMVSILLWVSQFFGLQDDTTPVIWLEKENSEPARQER